MIPFGLTSLMAVSLPIARRATKCFVPGASAIYLFNEGSGTTLTDYSGNGNDGALGAGAAAPTWATEGLTFNGAQYVDVSDDVVGSGSFSITVVHTPTGVVGWKSIATKHTGTGTNKYGFNIRIYDTSLNAYFNDPAGAEQKLTKSAAVVAGVPQAVTLTYDGATGTAVLYAGTTALVTRASTTHYPAIGQLLTIGAYSDTHAVGYAGDVSLVTVYPFALAPTQIAQNHATLKAMLAPRGVTLA